VGGAGAKASRDRGSKGRRGQIARTKSMLGTDAQCTVQKQFKQVAAKRRTASTKRKKQALRDEDSEDSGDEEGVDEEVALKRMRNAPRRRLEPML